MRIIPEGYWRKVEIMLINSGSKRSPPQFARTAFIVSLLLAVMVFFFAGDLAIVVSPLVFFGVFGLLHGFLGLAVERRAKFVESILPDALQLMAANARAGHIPSRALMLSARKEFGPLSDAIKKAGKDMLTGKSTEEALLQIPKHIKSDILERSIKLINRGVRSGGQFAELLEQNADDIRRKQAITKEVHANVTMYVIFIGFAGCIGAPGLYALSSFLTVTLGKLGASASLPETATSQFSLLQFTGVQIAPEFLFFFSLIAIFITTFFGGLIIGSISSGSEKAGVKFVPFLMVIGFAVFFAAQVFIEASFGSLII